MGNSFNTFIGFEYFLQGIMFISNNAEICIPLNLEAYQHEIKNNRPIGKTQEILKNYVFTLRP